MENKKSFKRFLNVDFLCDLVLFAIGGIWLYKSIDLNVNAFNDQHIWGKMGTIPAAISWVVLILTFIDFIRNIIKYAKADYTPKAAPEKKGLWLAVIEIAILVVYSFTMQKVGFIIDTVLLLAATMFISGSRNWKLIAAVSVGVTAALYVLFRYALTIVLPAGILKGIL